MKSTEQTTSQNGYHKAFYKTGEWKVYNENGTLKKTHTYKQEK